MGFSKTFTRLWKRLTPEERQTAAAAFWKEPSGESAATALAAIVKARHLRPQVARSLPVETKARALAGVLDPGEGVAASLVVVLHLDEREAEKLLALHDPLAALAETDDDVLSELIAQVETENEAVRKLLDEMLNEPGLLPDTAGDGPPPEVEIGELYQVVIECPDEAQQRAVYERLVAEGLKCRLLTL